MALYLANEFFIPVALSLVLVSLLWPVVQFLERRRIPASVGAAVSILGTVAIFATAVSSFQAPVRKFVNDIPKTIAVARPKITALSASVIKMLGSPARKAPAPTLAPKKPGPLAAPAAPRDSASDSTVRSADSAASIKADTSRRTAADSATKTTADSVARAKPRTTTEKPGGSATNFDLSSISDGAPATLSHALGIASSLLGDFVEIMLLAMFILAAGSTWKNKLAKAVTSLPVQDTVMETVDEMRTVVSQYVFMTTVINIVQACVVGLVLKLLGYPSPLLWGVLTFALEFIPYLGGMVMIGLLFVAGLAAGRDFPAAIYGPAAYLLVTSLQNNVVSPIVYGRGMKLNPVAILAGLMLLYVLWGVAGAFLAVPILAAFNVLASKLPSLKGVNAFISD